MMIHFGHFEDFLHARFSIFPSCLVNYHEDTCESSVALRAVNTTAAVTLLMATGQ